MAASTRCLSRLRSILLNKVAVNQSRRYLHTTSVVTTGQWKNLQRRTDSDDKTRLISELPDFTYLDGRPTPLTAAQKTRKEERITTAKRIVRLVKELEDAKVMYQNKIQNEKMEAENRQRQALRPKVQ